MHAEVQQETDAAMPAASRSVDIDRARDPTGNCSRGKTPMRDRRTCLLIALLLSLPCSAIDTPSATALESTIKGTGAVIGTVTAPKPFTAAHVYLRGQDKPVTFMVFTEGDKYQAINVLPGTYKISAERRGFAPVTQTITVTAGQTTTADLTMNEGPDVASNVN